MRRESNPSARGFAMTRCVLVGVLMLAVCTTARADDAEDRAVEVVKKLGGEVTRDETKDGRPVVKVDLARKRQVTDAGLEELAALKGLTTLDLSGTRVTNAGLKEVAALKGLTTLRLSDNSRVTDAGLKELAALKGLTTLRLGESGVTAEGVAQLKKALPNCSVHR
jgi:internalin A